MDHILGFGETFLFLNERYFYITVQVENLSFSLITTRNEEGTSIPVRFIYSNLKDQVFAGLNRGMAGDERALTVRKSLDANIVRFSASLNSCYL